MKRIPAPPSFRAGIFLLNPHEAWATDDGYIVMNVTEGHMGGYWVRDKTERWSQHLTMGDAKENIALLRAGAR